MILKCGPGEAWRRSVGPVWSTMKKACRESRGKEQPAYSKTLEG